MGRLYLIKKDADSPVRWNAPAALYPRRADARTPHGISARSWHGAAIVVDEVTRLKAGAGHLVDGIAFGLLTAGAFAALWPEAANATGA